MKKVFYLFAALSAFVCILVSCNNDNDPQDFDNEEVNATARAAALGFTDAATYIDSVREQCISGDHENCHILADGTHQPCESVQHNGQKHDGTHHAGSDHSSNNHSHGGHH